LHLFENFFTIVNYFLVTILYDAFLWRKPTLTFSWFLDEEKFIIKSEATPNYYKLTSRELLLLMELTIKKI